MRLHTPCGSANLGAAQGGRTRQQAASLQLALADSLAALAPLRGSLDACVAWVQAGHAAVGVLGYPRSIAAALIARR